MRIELLVVGDELLIGQTDPYPADVVRLIRGKGAHVSRLVVVPDEVDAIVDELVAAKGNGAGLVVVTGGLGPTLDDLTRHALATYLGEELVLDEEAMGWMRDSYAIRHGRNTEPRKEASLMAMVPKGSRPLPNPVGIACGIMAESDGMSIACLPGFPKEMLAMFSEHVLPLIGSDGIFEKEIWARHGESELEHLFQIIVKEFDVRVSSVPKEEWRERGNLVVIRGEKEEVEQAAERFVELLASEFPGDRAHPGTR